MFVTNKKFTTKIVAIVECMKAIRNILQDHKENIESLNDEIKSFRRYSSDLASKQQLRENNNELARISFLGNCIKIRSVYTNGMCVDLVYCFYL